MSEVEAETSSDGKRECFMARIFQLHSTYDFQDVIRAKQSHNTWESIKTCHDAEIVT